MAGIYIGTSGFSYDDWKGFFYPEKIKKSEMLRYYSAHFPTAEVNATFYAIPSPLTFASMSEKTPQNFRFAVKAPRVITHEEVVDLGAFGRFLDSIQPIVENEKLGCVLAQYPWSFRKSPEGLGRLRQLRDGMGDVNLVVEFRNAGWVCKETLAFLKENQIGFCCVDEPPLKGLMPRIVAVTSDTAYVRFHGRNSAKWWEHEAAWQRYDYLYSSDELQEWVGKVRDISAVARETYMFFNNHYHGQAAENAAMFASMLSLTA